MQVMKSDLFQSTADYILVTTNSFIKKNGCLVMGRGAAKQLYNSDPTIAYAAGCCIRDGGYPKDTKTNLPIYGVIILGRFGLFQVKTNWFDDARLDLISMSTDELITQINTQYIGKTFAMNFPGIGNGRLDYESVYNIINKLPDNVTVHMFA
jgi:hypothetical protein